MRHWKSWSGNSLLCLVLLAGSAEAQNTGTVNSCKATAAAPAYAEGSRQPLSCDLSGTLRATGGGGGGGAVTMADGADAAQGTTTDAAKTDSTLSGTVIAWLKGIVKILADVWDSVNHRLKVDGSGVTQPVSGTFWQATQPVSLASVPSHAVTNAGTFAVQAAQSGTWTVQPGNTANTTAWLFKLDQTGTNNDVDLASAIPAGSNLIGQAAPVATATTTNTTSTCYLSSAATTNATNCKSSAGNIYAIRAINTTGTLYYLRLYNAAAAPTCSSATGFIETHPIPASSTGAGMILSVPVGIAYGTGIGFCLTGGGSSTDNTNAATGVYLSIYYK